jgi:hypothetical protein
MRTLLLAVAATALLGIAGCANKEEPATNAVAQAEAALTEIRADASKYAPDELQKADASLAAQKERLQKEEYQQVLDAQPQLMTEVTALKDVVIAKQTQLAAATLEWERLKKEVPPLITTIENQVASMTGKRLPKEVTKEQFEAAKAELELMKTTWAEATAAFDAGNATEATDKGRVVEGKGKEVGQTLRISPV